MESNETNTIRHVKQCELVSLCHKLKSNQTQ